LEKPSAKAALKWKKDTRALGQAETCFDCVKECPSGALREIDVNDLRMGTAVVDRELCKAWRYNNCTFDCVDVCPLDAISITAGPVVDETKCVGCNQCNLVCIAAPVRAITVEPYH
jgi:ferredoxin